MTATMHNTKNGGSFRLVVLVGESGVEVPAHPGNVTRDRARALKSAYRTVRPHAETRVRKV